MVEKNGQRNIVLIGAGGHCKACIDVIEHESRYTIQGVLDKNLKIDQEICGYPVLGSDELIGSLVKEKSIFFITVGQVKDPSIRKSIFNLLKKFSAILPVIQSPFAIVSKHSQVLEGSILMHLSLVNANARIGKNCIINSKALIEHDSSIGDHSHISTAAVINGNCKIGNNVFVGSNAVVSHGISVADDVVVGSGAVVIRNILTSGTYAGNPARKIR